MDTITDRRALDTAPERRKSGYAARFVNETDEPPTDANLARVLSSRVHPEDYHDIRRYVRVWRQLRARQVTQLRRAIRPCPWTRPWRAPFDAQWDGGSAAPRWATRSRRVTHWPSRCSAPTATQSAD